MGTHQTDLIQFLEKDLEIPQDSISLAIQHSEQVPTLIPMVLWQYGLITLAQLERVFDWLENRSLMLQDA
ncbi:MAG: DUF2949 domain-containing protein [Leptolyngbyaceae cyanobacterium bins.59]|nr:DUF2949 domain-containing protein [Leptolyngbyaceae cyanobacterium bins.59]